MPVFIKQKILNLINSFVALPILGLDISGRTIKYIKLSENKGIEFDFFGTLDVPEHFIEGGEIKDEAGLIKILSAWREKEKKQLKSYFVAASLPEEKSFLRLIQLPNVKQEDIENAIRWEIEANIPLPPEDIVYDYEVIPSPEKTQEHFDVVIVAFPKSIVNSYLKVLHGAGFKPYALELESQAIVRTTIPNFQDNKARIIVDLGRERVSFILFSGKAIVFTVTINIGGVTFEQNIAKELKVSPEKSIELKHTVGLDKKELGGAVFSALVPVVSVIADELTKTVQYFQSRPQHAHGANNVIEEVLLTGGNAGLRGLDTYLASTLKIPVNRADVFTTIRERLASPIIPIPQDQSLILATALGLALRGIK